MSKKRKNLITKDSEKSWKLKRGEKYGKIKQKANIVKKGGKKEKHVNKIFIEGGEFDEINQTVKEVHEGCTANTIKINNLPKNKGKNKKDNNDDETETIEIIQEIDTVESGGVGNVIDFGDGSGSFNGISIHQKAKTVKGIGNVINF